MLQPMSAPCPERVWRFPRERLEEFHRYITSRDAESRIIERLLAEPPSPVSNYADETQLRPCENCGARAGVTDTVSDGASLKIRCAECWHVIDQQPMPEECRETREPLPVPLPASMDGLTWEIGADDSCWVFNMQKGIRFAVAYRPNDPPDAFRRNLLFQFRAAVETMQHHLNLLLKVSHADEAQAEATD